MSPVCWTFLCWTSCSAVCWTFLWRCTLCVSSSSFLMLVQVHSLHHLLLTHTHLFGRKGPDVFHHCWGSCQPLTCPQGAWCPLSALLWFGAAWFSLSGLPPNSSTTHDGWSSFHYLWSKISKLTFTGGRDCNLRD